MDKLIITAAICGAEGEKEKFPQLPVTAEELALEARACYEAGASIIHLHVRDQNGEPTQDREVFREAIEAIRKACSEVIIQPSTGGAVGMAKEERKQPLDLPIEMASLTTGTVNFGDGVFYNSPEYVEYFASLMQERGIKPEIEVFETGMIQNAVNLAKRGILNTPIHFDFVLGVPGAMPATAKNLLHLVETIPSGSTWTVAGIGRHELPMAAMAIVLGGHVRVGFEDNMYYRYRQLAESNAELVARVARLAAELERGVATPAEAREILGLKQRGED